MEVHVWECYRNDKLAVNLRAHFKNSVRDKIKNQIPYLANRIGIHPSRLYEYFVYQKSDIPLYVLIELCKKFDVTLDNLEKEIIMYKQLHTPSKNSVQNPKLPIDDSPYLTSIVSNLFFDGSVPKDGKGTYYNQKSQEIMDNFVMRVKDVFGDVYYTIRTDHRGILKCRVPRIIGEICKHVYDVDSFGSLDSKVPDKLFKLPDEHKIAFILSAIVDEGSISYDGEILFGVNNEKLAEGLRELCSTVHLNPTKVKRKSGSNYYYFYLKPKEKFYELFMDIKAKYALFSLGYKEERLKHALGLNGLPFKHTKAFADERRQKIIELLSQKPLSANQLSQVLLIRQRSLRRHISFLLNKKKIVKVSKNKNNYIYGCPH